MQFVRCLKLLHYVVMNMSTPPSINSFLAIGHIVREHYNYMKTYVEIFCNTCPGTVLKNTTSLQMLLTHFSSSRPKKWFPCMGKLAKKGKEQNWKRKPLFCITVLNAHISGNSFKYRQKLMQAESTVQPDK